MPATQLVFLVLLYSDSQEGLIKSEVVAMLNLTKTSITRATSQMEAMGLISQEKAGKEIRIKRNYSQREYVERVKDYLIIPVQKILSRLICKRREGGFGFTDMFVQGQHR